MARLLYCPYCDRDLKLDAFSASQVKPNTRRARCKKCSIAYSRAWNLAHPKRAAASKKRYRPKALIKMREWNKKNRAYLTAYMRKWRKKNPGYANRYMREWRAKNREHHLRYKREWYRAKKAAHTLIPLRLVK